jgi:hypothetical protein
MQHAPRARAVAEAPVQALLARADELARRWAIALILALPPERIGEFPLEPFARDAPGLCAQVVRALESDSELERIAAGVGGERGQAMPAGRLSELTAARDGPGAVEAVEALRGVLWEALLDELRWPGFEQWPARQVADLADRLAYVCSAALGSSLAVSAVPVPVSLPVPVPVQAPAQAQAIAAKPAPVRQSERAVIGDGVVLIDEREAGPARHWPQPPRGGSAQVAEAPARDERTRARPLPWDIPLRDERSDGPIARSLADGAGGEDA